MRAKVTRIGPIPVSGTNFTGDIVGTAGLYTAANKRFAQGSAFADYTRKPSDQLIINSGTGVIGGRYLIRAKIDDSTLQLANSPRMSEVDRLGGDIDFRIENLLVAQMIHDEVGASQVLMTDAGNITGGTLFLLGQMDRESKTIAIIALDLAVISDGHINTRLPLFPLMSIGILSGTIGGGAPTISMFVQE